MVFIDTNVWVYALSGQDHAKRQIAIELITSFIRHTFAVRFGNLVIAFAHKTFDGIYRSRWIDNCLTSGQIPDQDAVFFGVCTDAGGDATAFRICNHDGFTAFKNAQNRICRAQINAYNGCHVNSFDC